MSIPYKCPVCEGRGNVSEGFYDRKSQYLTTSSDSIMGVETCRSCSGTGVVWDNSGKPGSYYIDKVIELLEKDKIEEKEVPYSVVVYAASFDSPL